MITMMHKVFCILMVALALTGCSGRGVDRTLDAAENLMESQPDSVLAMLERVDGAALRGERQARHALLLSQAYEKNYIDLTDDSLISIAVDYYGTRNNLHYKMMALYYRISIHMNCQEYDEALSLSFDAERLAEKLGDSAFLARIKLTIAQAYLFSFNQEGAQDYFKQTLPIVRTLNNPVWMNVLYGNLANSSLYRKDFAKALEYVDSAKQYVRDDRTAYEHEMLAQIGLAHYNEADSIYRYYIAPNNPSRQMKAYKLMVDFHLGKTLHITDSLSAQLATASYSDSIVLASVGTQLSFAQGDYYNAWYYTELVFRETNRILTNVSDHSLYRIQLEHEKQENIEKNNAIRTRNHIAFFAIIVSVLLLLLGITYIRYLRSRHERQITQAQNDLLIVSAEVTQLQKNLRKEIDDHLKEQLRHESEISSLTSQIESGRIAAQELFLSRYSWVEELGNILLDSEASKNSNRVVRDLKKKLAIVKTQQFVSELIAVINKYRNDLLTRVNSDCPALSDTELNILALLCANLSPRIISFILDIKLQTVYNSKSLMKRKIQECSPMLFDEIHDIFG